MSPNPPEAKRSTIVKYNSRVLDMVSDRNILDAKLLRAGSDDTGFYSLYRPENESEPLVKGHFLLKVKTNQFIEVTPE